MKATITIYFLSVMVNIILLLLASNELNRIIYHRGKEVAACAIFGALFGFLVWFAWVAGNMVINFKRITRHDQDTNRK